MRRARWWTCNPSRAIGAGDILGAPANFREGDWWEIGRASLAPPHAVSAAQAGRPARPRPRETPGTPMLPPEGGWPPPSRPLHRKSRRAGGAPGSPKPGRPTRAREVGGPQNKHIALLPNSAHGAGGVFGSHSGRWAVDLAVYPRTPIGYSPETGRAPSL